MSEYRADLAGQAPGAPAPRLTECDIGLRAATRGADNCSGEPVGSGHAVEDGTRGDIGDRR